MNRMTITHDEHGPAAPGPSDPMTELIREANKMDAAPIKADGGGMRFNAGKNQLELIPAEWIWGLGMVLTRGAVKYAVRNWERGMKWSYPFGCALRHMLKFYCGERYDAETGCHHLFMAAWNMCALATYDIRGIGENDLTGNGKLEWLDKCATEPGPALLALMKAATEKKA
jgi:hypothetical protein